MTWGSPVNAAVFYRPHEPLAIEQIEIAAPNEHEVLVRTVATGVCHSDLHYVDGHARPASSNPLVLGHEGAGIVEAVGSAVTEFKPGDHVVACLSGFCGACQQCLTGHPNRCTMAAVSRPASEPPRLSRDGQRYEQMRGISSYAEQMLLNEHFLVKVDDDLPLESVALIGCGVLTGVGAALKSSGLRAGESVAVFGCGGVGLSIIQGARSGGARQIIALDRFDSKLEFAKQFGATHTVNTSDVDAVEAVRELSKGGVDHAFEAVGIPMLVRQTVESLAIGGTATIVGVLPAGSMIEFPWESLRPECKVQTSRMGSNAFRVDIPRYLELYRQGRLMLDEMVSRRGRLEDVNAAFEAMSTGEVARTVLLFD
jgi:S-(hydroxymethyl)glutathione dehydrogenase/alcohol dehydrogenase